MFTIEQIKSAHSKVKSGADFPSYIQDLKQLVVISYDAYVSDGHTDYFGANNFKITSPAKYESLAIANETDENQFKADLKAHQQGKTNYPTFCSDCAKSGIEKWVVILEKMTCTYYDKAGNEILEEIIPD
ncbi:DUF1398 domain-containing protein [Flavobacterium azooxidireducens]|uniref:DUF1398 domain-containing protein n=1 Tax=Flavobacterium azooxidireducens TaxID=1871076 RepID=A0ABY4KBE3_9FLAO|nr:DUF1398 family protein [Flavobacterium azooxidireducens]UPQ78111.1 DUF1398 domain-containing protein [Flavobacterium azooxidireducens]